MDKRRIQYDVELFKREYSNVKTLTGLAKIFNVSPTMISKWARENDMPYKSDRRSESEVKEIYQAYKDFGISFAMDKFSLTRSKLYHWRKVYEKSLLPPPKKPIKIPKNKKGFGW